MKTIFNRLYAALTFVTIFGTQLIAQNPWNGKVILQGFWWDYYNNNYPLSWSNYVTELAPRLREIGIDAVWIPPTIKNGSTSSNGYSPFDAYDLGDKFQKGNVKTRMGNKDELLRMVGVLHANGMDVIQDVVLNHVDNAGSNNGSGGIDPLASNGDNNQYKNFRYSSFTKPATDETAADYLSRNGRWSKNWPNFNANQGNPCSTGDWCAALFGPDISYYSGAYGQSSNASFNPTQSSDYMRTEARNWMVWMKKQTGVDGFRFDAVKHFPYWAMQDFLYNVKYNAGFANGGANMVAIGEYVGNGSELDTWINNVKTSNGGTEDMTGTFDFSLRGCIKNMISGNGGYDIGSIPGCQQANRFRTIPFVNNHDTYRPTLAANGNINGWNTGNEIGGHIEPGDVRLSAAYAIAFAVDGSPQVFFEDLFNIYSTGKRYTHAPTSTTDLPINDDIANIIWCHQKLNFKKGSYKVRWQAQDLLIVERGYKAGPENSYAIIGVNDSYTNWQAATIQTDFGANKQLHDYSGANTNDIYTDAQGRVTINVPPCNGTNLRKGYCIWGPAGISGGFAPAQRNTTQEWEMADDLGDNHASSLKQGGALPASSTAQRTAGKIFAENGKAITVKIYPTNTTKSITVNVYNNAGTSVATRNGTGTLTLNYTPTSTGFYSVKIKNTSATNPSQKVYVNITYTSPKTITTASFPARLANPALQQDAPATNIVEVKNYPDPFVANTTVVVTLAEEALTNISVYNMHGQLVQQVLNKVLPKGLYTHVMHTKNMMPGNYVLHIQSGNTIKTHNILVMQ